MSVDASVTPNVVVTDTTSPCGANAPANYDAALALITTQGTSLWKTAVNRAQVYVEQSLQPRFPDVNVVDLQDAWQGIVKRAKLVQHHIITREELSVREHMSIVLRKLQGRKFLEFEDLFDATRGMPVLVVTFIALLELAKECLLEITQAESFAPIYVRLAYTPA